MKVITSIDDATAAVGSELGVSDWQEIDQKRINDFADATGDHQWIHIDAERAKTESPYGTTIAAHGFLTLSMIPALTKDNYRVENAKMAINYGLNKVRFIAAVPSGGRIRARSELVDATKVDDNTVNMTVKNTHRTRRLGQAGRGRPRRSCGCAVLPGSAPGSTVRNGRPPRRACAATIAKYLFSTQLRATVLMSERLLEEFGVGVGHTRPAPRRVTRRRISLQRLGLRMTCRETLSGRRIQPA